MRSMVSLLLVLIASLCPLLLPIARNLEYEYASLTAYALLILLPLGLRFWPGQKVPTARLAALQIGVAAVISILPAWLLYRGGFCACSENDFRFFWLIQVLPHLLLAYGIGWLLLKARDHGVRHGVLMYFVALLGLFIHLAWILWSMPQKRITHLLSGFVHGAIYDNNILLDPGILWTRGSHALIACCLIAMVLGSRRLGSWIAALFFVAAVGTSWKASDYPSVAHGLEALNQLMPEKREGKYFTLHFRKSSSVQTDEWINQIFDSAEFHTQDLAEKLIMYNTRVQIYVYPSRRDKKLWFGGDGTDITDVRNASIHITAESWPHATLRHELVHALSSSFAFHGLGFHPNMAFTEGFAVALAPSEDDISLHQGAASLIRSQRVLDPAQLFSPLFWGESGSRAYTVAGSLIKYLIDNTSVDQVKKLYAGDSWEDVFGKQADSVLAEWRKFLETEYPGTGQDLRAEALYRYPGILYDSCPHSKALLGSSSSEELVTIRQPKDWDSRRDYWPWRLKLEDGPFTRLQILRTRFFDEGATESLLAQVRKERHDPPETLEDVDATNLEFDILWKMGRSEEAHKFITAYAETIERYRVGDTYLRQIWSRSMLSQLPPEVGGPWLSLLSGSQARIPELKKAPKNWIIAYLTIRNHRFTVQEKKLFESLLKFSPPIDLPDSFAVEWWKFIGTRYFELRDYEKAIPAFEQAAQLAPEGAKEAIRLAAAEARFVIRTQKLKERLVH